jgi:hypothetical protein
MKFPYKKYGKEILRPVIPIEILHDGASVRYEVLVDSGADMCIFPGEIGELLRLDVGSGNEQRVAGITGEVRPHFVHDVSIRVGGWAYNIHAGFLPDMTDIGYGVVGQHGFFDLFKISFNLSKEEIELKPIAV